jgi:predicted nucleotide-binding protein (sugar kinase/HSP70/actin superfamily)
MEKKGYKSNKRIDTSSSCSVDDHVINLVVDHKDVNEKAPVVHVMDQGSSNTSSITRISSFRDIILEKLIAEWKANHTI